jgi:hypothetical protein
MIPCLRFSSVRLVPLAASVLAVLAANARAQTTPPVGRGIGSEPAPSIAPPAATQPAETKEAPAKKPARYTSKAFGTSLGREPPDYVKPLSLYGWPGCEKIDWLDFGLEHRTRFEHRDDDYRRPQLQQDDQFLMRSRAYLGIEKIFDPLRFGVEFQDARQFNSDFPETNRDVDEADFLQAFAELYFKDALGQGQPLSLRAGRMSLEYLDTHTVARSRWANTTTAFDGFRLRLGEPTSDWQFDFFAVQPVDRRLRQPDRGDEERWFYGLVGSWRKWQNYVTLEPYYFILDEDRKDPAVADREIHTLGLRAFGPIADTKFDYDVDAAFQTGHDGQNEQRAFAAIGELGYSFEHAWKPRLSFSTMYASGDRNPNDQLSERFARLFDSTHGYSTWDLFTWQNVISPKVRLELKPTEKLRFDTSYGAYWLASDSDAWVVPNRRDPTGTSGDCIGQEVDLRLRYQLDPRVEFEIGYSHFFAGPFIENTGAADDADFFYVQTTLRL